jgi:hypothetical protein
MVNKIELKNDQSLGVKVKNKSILMTPAEDLVNELAGSLKTQENYSDSELDDLIMEAKKKHFSKTPLKLLD